MGKTSPLLMGMRKEFATLGVMHWSKTPPFLMGMRKDVSNISSHALEFVWVRIPFSNGCEKRRLYHF